MHTHPSSAAAAASPHQLAGLAAAAATPARGVIVDVVVMPVWVVTATCIVIRLQRQQHQAYVELCCMRPSIVPTARLRRFVGGR